jgi:hypothetical protein
MYDFPAAINEERNLLNITVPLSTELRDCLYVDGSRHKIYTCDTSKVFLFDEYKSWCLKRGVQSFSHSAFHVKTHGWVKTAGVRDGVCSHCHLSVDAITKINSKGIQSLDEVEKQNYLLYIVYKVLCHYYFLFMFRLENS